MRSLMVSLKTTRDGLHGESLWTSCLEAIAIRLEVIAIGLEAIAIRLEAVASN